MELTFERTQPKKWTLRLNPCKHRLYTVRFGSFCSCLKQKKIRRYFRTQRKENPCVLQPLFKNRMWFRFLILWCSLLILRQTSGIKKQKNQKKNQQHVIHTLLTTQSLKISGIVLPAVCVCARCDWAMMPSPRRPLIHYLFTSSIRAAACLVQDAHILLFIVPKKSFVLFFTGILHLRDLCASCDTYEVFSCRDLSVKACRWCERTPDTLLTHTLTRREVTTWELRETGEQLISGISTCVIRVIYQKKRTQRPVHVHNNTSEAVEGNEKEPRGQEVTLEKCPQRHRKEEELVTVGGLDLHEMQRDLAL